MFSSWIEFKNTACWTISNNQSIIHRISSHYPMLVQCLKISSLCVWGLNWDKGGVHRAFPQFCSEYTYTLYFKKMHEYCVYYAEKSL
jgi:hypothetical protein